MSALAGMFYITSALLALAGAAKVLDPFPAARALASARFPHHVMAVRALGVAELVLAAAAVAAGGRMLPGLVGLLYLGFAGFVALLLRQAKATGGKAASCGCFGVSDTPPGWLHVAANVICAAVGLSGTIVALDPFADVVRQQPALGIPFVGYVLLGTYLTYLVLAVLPQVLHPQTSSSVAEGFHIHTASSNGST